MKQILSVFLCLTISSVYGIELRGGDNIVISDTVRHNLYLGGGTVTINAPVLGDLIIAGGSITINDSVAGDILLAGGEVFFYGATANDIRCAGGRLHIKNNVSGDLIVAGGEVSVDRRVQVGELVIAGGNVIMDGRVLGEMKCYAGNAVLNGEVYGNAEMKGGTVTINGSINGRSVLAAEEIILGSKASFNGDVRYWCEKGQLDFGGKISNGKAIFDESLALESGPWRNVGLMSVLAVLWYVGMVLVMLILLQYFFGARFRNKERNLRENRWKAFGYGFLFFIGAPVAIVISLVTLIGIPLGLILLFTYILALIFSTAVASLLYTHWLRQRRNANWGFWRMIFISLGIFVVIKIIGMIPFAGWLLVFIMKCLAFGALLIGLSLRRSN